MDTTTLALAILCGIPLALLAAVAISIAIQNYQAGQETPGLLGTPPIPSSSRSAPPVSAAELAEQMRALLAQNQWIEAYRLYRQAARGGLAQQAQQALDSLQRGQPLSPTSQMAGDLRSQIKSLLAQGRKLEAIQLYRKANGVGLLQAKQAVEAIEQGMQTPPQMRP